MLERPHPLLKSLDEATKRIDELELELKKLKDTLAWAIGSPKDRDRLDVVVPLVLQSCRARGARAEAELERQRGVMGWHFICERDGQVHGVDCRCTALDARESAPAEDVEDAAAAERTRALWASRTDSVGADKGFVKFVQHGAPAEQVIDPPPALRAKPKEEHMQHPTSDYCSFCRAQWPCGEEEK